MRLSARAAWRGLSGCGTCAPWSQHSWLGCRPTIVPGERGRGGKGARARFCSVLHVRVPFMCALLACSSAQGVLHVCICVCMLEQARAWRALSNTHACTHAGEGCSTLLHNVNLQAQAALTYCNACVLIAQMLQLQKDLLDWIAYTQAHVSDPLLLCCVLCVHFVFVGS